MPSLKELSSNEQPYLQHKVLKILIVFLNKPVDEAELLGSRIHNIGLLNNPARMLAVTNLEPERNEN